MRFKFLLGLAGAAVLATSLIAPSASAETLRDDTAELSETAVALANPDVPLDVIEGLPSELLDRSDLWLSPEISSDTVFVSAETGLPLMTQTNAEIEFALAACGSWRSVVAPVGGSWYTYTHPCAYVGGTATSTKTYQTSKSASTSGTGCWQLKGYAWESGVVKEKWFPVGCNTGAFNVAWQNSASYPAVKVSAAGIIGFAGSFR